MKDSRIPVRDPAVLFPGPPVNSTPESPLFLLPEQGTFQANGPDDPLPYYYKPLIGRLYRARIEQGLALLRPPYSSILEIGYGSGLLLPTLCRLSEKVCGVDLLSEPEKIHPALAQCGVHCSLYRGDVTDDIFSPQSFDLVVAFSIFEHIRELQPVFKRIHTLLMPRGRLLVGMPRVDRTMSRFFSLIGFSGIDEHHVTDHRQCLRTAGECGFTVVDSSRLPGFLPRCCGLYFTFLLEKRDGSC